VSRTWQTGDLGFEGILGIRSRAGDEVVEILLEVSDSFFDGGVSRSGCSRSSSRRSRSRGGSCCGGSRGGCGSGCRCCSLTSGIAGVDCECREGNYRSNCHAAPGSSVVDFQHKSGCGIKLRTKLKHGACQLRFCFLGAGFLKPLHTPASFASDIYEKAGGEPPASTKALMNASPDYLANGLRTIFLKSSDSLAMASLGPVSFTKMFDSPEGTMAAMRV